MNIVKKKKRILEFGGCFELAVYLSIEAYRILASWVLASTSYLEGDGHSVQFSYAVTHIHARENFCNLSNLTLKLQSFKRKRSK